MFWTVGTLRFNVHWIWLKWRAVTQRLDVKQEPHSRLLSPLSLNPFVYGTIKLKNGIQRPKYCTLTKTLGSPLLFNFHMPSLPGLRQVKSQQLTATVNPVETVAECFIDTDMAISTKSIRSKCIRFIAWKLTPHNVV